MASLSEQLQVGQKVHLQDLPYGYQITVLGADQPGHDVVEVASEYVVLDDAAAGVTLRLPRYLISALTATVQPPVAQSA